MGAYPKSHLQRLVTGLQCLKNISIVMKLTFYITMQLSLMRTRKEASKIFTCRGLDLFDIDDLQHSFRVVPQLFHNNAISKPQIDFFHRLNLYLH